MNERIFELIKQATVSEPYYPAGNDGHPEYRIYMCEEKFAKLIVKECIDKIITYDLVPGHSAKWEDIYDIHTRLLQDLGEELKEHFGVEE
jgi:hypothetical protein